MLDAWYAYRPDGEIEWAGIPGLNYVTYTLGFAGDLGEDASHSSSLYCDPSGRDRDLRQVGECAEPLPYPHRRDPIDLDKSTLPSDWCPTADVFRYGDAVSDVIYITSLLREPARLHVTFGGSTTVIDLPAEQIFAAASDERQAAVVPYGPDRLGTPAFVLERNGVTIASWSGRLEITDQPVQYDGTVSRNYQTYADFYELPERRATDVAAATQRKRHRLAAASRKDRDSSPR
jgi:hypothetical protein